MGAPIEGGGVFSAGTAGLLNCPEDWRDSEACWCAGGGCMPLKAADDEPPPPPRPRPEEPPVKASILAISLSQSLGATAKTKRE